MGGGGRVRGTKRSEGEVYIYIHIYIYNKKYREKERERDIDRDIYVCIFNILRSLGDETRVQTRVVTPGDAQLHDDT